MSPNFKVVVTDQVFPSIDAETELLAAIGARIEVADGTATRRSPSPNHSGRRQPRSSRS